MFSSHNPTNPDATQPWEKLVNHPHRDLNFPATDDTLHNHHALTQSLNDTTEDSANKTTTPKMYHNCGPSAQGLTIEDYRKARLTADRLHLNSVPQTIIAQLSRLPPLLWTVVWMTTINTVDDGPVM